VVLGVLYSPGEWGTKSFQNRLGRPRGPGGGGASWRNPRPAGASARRDVAAHIHGSWPCTGPQPPAAPAPEQPRHALHPLIFDFDSICTANISGFDLGHSLPPNPGSRFLGGVEAVVHEDRTPPPVRAAREYGGGRLWAQGRVRPIGRNEGGFVRIFLVLRTATNCFWSGES
jgi:hypothetical protein